MKIGKRCSYFDILTDYHNSDGVKAIQTINLLVKL